MESISLVQMGGHMNTYFYTEEKLMKSHPALWMPMIDTADIVAERYGVSREYQDEYALRSQQRIAAAQANGIFKDEIVPMTVEMKKVDKATGAESRSSSTSSTRTSATAPRPRSKASPRLKTGARARASSSPPATPRQLSDGAAAVVIMEGKEAEQPRARAAGRVHAASRSRAASRTRWASARSSPCRASWNATA